MSFGAYRCAAERHTCAMQRKPPAEPGAWVSIKKTNQLALLRKQLLDDFAAVGNFHRAAAVAGERGVE
jgi:hypothetical protein